MTSKTYKRKRKKRKDKSGNYYDTEYYWGKKVPEEMLKTGDKNDK